MSFTETNACDGQGFEEFEAQLRGNLYKLWNRMSSGSYMPPPVLSVEIPKPGGGVRTLGISTIADRVAQGVVKRALEPELERHFHADSYGYRPGKSALDAVAITRQRCWRYDWVVDLDIRAFFDNIDHDRLLEMLSERIDDRAFLDLIRKWLKAGILETDGQELHPETGTPQGGIVSPILANVYLHHVLDLWFEGEVKPRCGGRALLIRYADDYVCAFQYRADAKRFYRVLAQRLEKFGLRVAPDKTRILRFSRFHPGLPRRFTFLGFELYWTRDGRGDLRVMKHTARKRLQRAERRIKGWIKANRHLPGREFIKALNREKREHLAFT